MKRYLTSIVAFLLLTACSAQTSVNQVSNAEKPSNQPTATATATQPTTTPATATTTSGATASQPSGATTTPATPTMSSGQLQAHYIDVGQGDSIYIHDAKGENILIDGGKANEGKVVESYLRNHGVQQLDVVISTHPDSDHMGGLIQVINDFSVKSVYAPKLAHNTLTYEHFLQAVQRKGIQIQSAKTGVTIPLQDANAQAKFLAPVRAYSTEDTNDYSAVLDIQYGTKNFLFTGDAEFPSENDMMAQHVLPHVDVLKVSHHGAESASSLAFLNTIKPTYAIISVGANNSYGHPRKNTLDHLQAINAKIYRTDLQGNIVASTDGNTINIQTQR